MTAFGVSNSDYLLKILIDPSYIFAIEERNNSIKDVYLSIVAHLSLLGGWSLRLFWSSASEDLAREESKRDNFVSD